MKLLSAHSPVYSNAEHTAITLMALFEGFPSEHPFTASSSDQLPHGREIFDSAVSGSYGAVTVYQPAPPAVPEFVEMVQARLALLHAGHLATVKAAIAAMPGIEGEEARETWEFAPRVRRDSSLVAAMGVLLSLTDKQLDDLFLDAATR